MCLDPARVADTMMLDIIRMQETSLEASNNIAELMRDESMCKETLDVYIEAAHEYAVGLDNLARIANAYCHVHGVTVSESTRKRCAAHNKRMQDSMTNAVIQGMNAVAVKMHNEQRREQAEVIFRALFCQGEQI